MSGVVYALFGYIWMKGLYQPEQRMAVHPNNVNIMIALAIPLHDRRLGPIANAAHVVGLAVGLAAGSRGSRIGRCLDRPCRGIVHGFATRHPRCAGGRRDRRGIHRRRCTSRPCVGSGSRSWACSVPRPSGPRAWPGGWASRGSIATWTTSWPTSGRGSSTSPRPTRPLRAGPAGAGVGPSRRLREAAGVHLGGDLGPAGTWPARGRLRRRR